MKISNEKLNILVIWSLWSYYNKQHSKLKQDIKLHLMQNFDMEPNDISIHTSCSIPFENRKSNLLNSGKFDIIIIAKNKIPNNNPWYSIKQSSKSFEKLFYDKWFVWTCTVSKSTQKQIRNLQPINKSNIKQAIDESMKKYLHIWDDDLLIDNQVKFDYSEYTYL